MIAQTTVRAVAAVYPGMHYPCTINKPEIPPSKNYRTFLCTSSSFTKVDNNRCDTTNVSYQTSTNKHVFFGDVFLRKREEEKKSSLFFFCYGASNQSVTKKMPREALIESVAPTEPYPIPSCRTRQPYHSSKFRPIPSCWPNCLPTWQ